MRVPLKERRMACPNFKKFIESQTIALHRAVDENKWYLSEQARRDVGMNAAMQDFTERHCYDWATKFQEDFCSKCEFVCKRNGGRGTAVAGGSEVGKRTEATS